MNLLNAVLGAVPGLITHNPMMVAQGFLMGGQGGASAGSTMGSIDNAGLQAAMAADDASTTALFTRALQFQTNLNWQAEAFDEMASQKSESMREVNVLKDIAMKQRQADNRILKEFITMIKD